ncbi:hypothetical protein B0H14DRAFT_3443047 [Mycena olivaceomarginata]|nr:hypothetical protein B0H14DRAFT_3443047 [Mycena olivaceomarginata]
MVGRLNLLVVLLTCVHAKDHEKSLAFYKDVMGMKLKRVSETAGAKSNLYFLEYG